MNELRNKKSFRPVCLRIFAVLLLVLSVSRTAAQQLAVKTNVLQWATTTPNLGAEVALSPRMTVAMDWGYNPWTFSDNRKLRHWMVRLEPRWWFCEKFGGHFMGLYGTYTQFNAGGVKLPLGIFPDLQKYRYEGDSYDVGLSYGYQWMLGNRWNLELSAGFGYSRYSYRQYLCATCGSPVDSAGRPVNEAPRQSRGWFGPTRAALSLIFIIK